MKFALRLPVSLLERESRQLLLSRNVFGQMLLSLHGMAKHLSTEQVAVFQYEKHLDCVSIIIILGKKKEFE